MDFKDYYQALGVERTATEEDTRKAYCKLARKYHADVSKEAVKSRCRRPSSKLRARPTSSWRRPPLSIRAVMWESDAMASPPFDTIPQGNAHPLRAAELAHACGATAALILDLEHEVRRLKALLGARGLGREI